MGILKKQNKLEELEKLVYDNLTDLEISLSVAFKEKQELRNIAPIMRACEKRMEKRRKEYGKLGLG